MHGSEATLDVTHNAMYAGEGYNNYKNFSPKIVFAVKISKLVQCHCC